MSKLPLSDLSVSDQSLSKLPLSDLSVSDQSLSKLPLSDLSVSDQSLSKLPRSKDRILKEQILKDQIPTAEVSKTCQPESCWSKLCKFKLFLPAAWRPSMLKLGLFLVCSMSILAIAAPWLAPYDPTALHLQNILEPPSSTFWLGTDALGRDVFSRLLYGGRVSLWVGFVAVSISVIIGLVLGLLAGYFGGIADELIMRGVDVMLCFPSFFLILAVIAFLEPSLINIMVVIGLTSWMGVARLVRAETLSLVKRDFVDAARLSAVGSWRIILVHILPNALAPVLVSATLGIAGAILVESSLSFLGLGVQPPDPSWGNMLMEGKDVLEIAPWLSLYPGLAILVTVLGYNLLGESLRDVLDPRLQKS